MVVVPAGEFIMGSPLDEEGHMSDEGPQHKVKFGHRFAVAKFELTSDEWDACVALDGCTKRPDEGWMGRADGGRPVIDVRWDDAKAYVAWLSRITGQPYRLLSEAEWEYAARAGSQMAYPWGNSTDDVRPHRFSPRTLRRRFESEPPTSTAVGRCERPCCCRTAK